MTMLQGGVQLLAPAADSCGSADAPDPRVDLDRRWVAWQAKGQATDIRMRRMTNTMLWLAVAGLVSWQTWVLVLSSVVGPHRS